ncbi:hypothetical protein LLF88_07045 [bacterium]|nr:hypothetical protein [bacterium]
MKNNMQARSLRTILLRHRRWLAGLLVLILLAGVSLALVLRAQRTSLRIYSDFKTADYPVAVVGTAEGGYVATAEGQVFSIDAWASQGSSTQLQDSVTFLALSTSGKYLLAGGQRLTLLDNSLHQKWSRKTTTASVVEQALFTSTGQIAAVYSFLADQSRQVVTYNLAGTYLDSYTVPDFGSGSQVSLAHSGMLVITLSSGTIYTISPKGAVIAKFTVPNPDQKLAGLVSAVDQSGTRIIAGYSFSVSGSSEPLPRYIFDQTGKIVSQVTAASDNPGLRAVGDSFVILGRTADVMDKEGKRLISASKLNFDAIDASISDGSCALLFQEQTSSQTAVYFLGVYDMESGILKRQWSTAEPSEIRVFQMPGLRSVLALGTGIFVLAP